MAHGAFQHRSGRVISLARVSLAVLFLIAIWADPSQPSLYPAAAYALLCSYLAASACYLGATWSNWWLEHRLARPAHLYDIALFGIMVYLTNGYTSPFYTFFVFLILSATIRWSWKATAATAAVVVVVFLLAGLAATRWDQVDPDITRIVARGTYLVILSLLLIWFSLNERSGLLQYVGGPDGEDDKAAPRPTAAPPVRSGLEKAAAATDAGRAAVIWWDEDEPWLHLATLVAGGFSEERFAPGSFEHLVDERLKGRIFLFDAHYGHVLAARPGYVEPLRDIAEPLDPALRARIGCVQGLVIPVATETYGALFVLCEIPGLCADDLKVGKRLGDEFAAALRQSSMLGMFEAAAADRTRLAISRDLHDTVVQLLAGTSMRLQGVRRAITAGRDVDDDLKALQDALAVQQQAMRMLIDGLRSAPAAKEAARPLCGALAETAQKAERQWAMKVRLEGCADDIRLRQPLIHEIDQLVREAIANAARHAQAGETVLEVTRQGHRLSLAIRDNGCGFAAAGAGEARPRSLEERVQALGGSLDVHSTSAGSTVTISLPVEAAQ